MIALLGPTLEVWDDTAQAEAATTALPVAPVRAAEPVETGLSDDATPHPSAEPVPTTTAIQAVARRTWTRGLLALAACLTLLVGVGFGAGALYNWMNRPAAVVALDEIESAPDAQSATVAEDEGLTATVHWSPQLGKAVLVSDGLPSIPEDETFELWFVRGDEAISAGTFAADGSKATTALDGEMQPGDVIAVTIEPAGGAPGGAPTGDPIVAVPTA
ncbi:anti-sigma factor [Microbacterium sp. Sa4CUA7]|uniref:Anti-sigma factor n=1 Tax=Microbacterium pullorum TaxID=2762236 RepID=A0ABR8RYM6_9MICO|nr:anti-sigma factor [Microbacterium pullorum]